MDRMIETTISGKNVHLCYSISVLFDVADKFGTIQNALDLIQSEGREAFEAVKWFALRMSEEGALCRRELGYPEWEALTEKEVSMRMPPVEFSGLRERVVEAIGLGYQREIQEGESQERDLGLEELNAKKPRAGV